MLEVLQNDLQQRNSKKTEFLSLSGRKMHGIDLSPLISLYGIVYSLYLACPRIESVLRAIFFPVRLTEASDKVSNRLDVLILRLAGKKFHLGV